MNQTMNLRYMKVLRACLAVQLSASLTAHGMDKKDILFYAPMDGSADATIAKGRPSSLSTNLNPTFVEGHEGKGYLTGGANSELKYETVGNMDLRAGSVAMWIKPLDWAKSDSYMRHWFRVGDGDFAFLYKFWGESVTWLVQQRRFLQRIYYLRPASCDTGGLIKFDWERGKWSHLIATWSGNQMGLYINGEFDGVIYVPTANILETLGSVFTIGGTSRRDFPTQDTVIDDVMVLRTPVNPTDARRICAEGLRAFEGAQSPITAPSLRASAGYVPSHDKVRLDLSVLGRRPDEIKALTVNYEIRASEKDAPLLAGQLPLGAIHLTPEVDLKALPIGKYGVRLTLKNNQQHLAQAECEFEKNPSPEWLGNTIGKGEEVPSPWTPMAVDGNAASCWGRTYAFGKSAFPEQITTQGQALLARPVTLAARMGRELQTVNTHTFTWDKVTPTRVEFSSISSIGDAKLFVRGWMEFDGFLWFEIKLEPGSEAKKAALNSLSFEIPLSRKAATLMHGPMAGKVRDFECGLLPFFWAGNEVGGLQISTRDIKDWMLNDRDKMFSLVTTPSEVVVRFQLIDHTVSLDRPFQYTVGLHATPVKPLPKAARSWDMGFCNGKYVNDQYKRLGNFGVYWEQWNRIGEGDGAVYGYQVASANTLNDLKQGFHSIGIKPFIYWNQLAVWLGDPVLKTFGGEWRAAYSPGADRRSNVHPDIELPSARDYLVYGNWKLLKDNPELAKGVRGFYLDSTRADWNQDEIFTVLGLRDVQKRFYRMLKQDWPELMVINHQSSSLEMSQLAFTDIYFTGEHLTTNAALIKDLNYYHVLSLDGMRAELGSAQFGVQVMFLPEFVRAVGDDATKLKRIMGPEGVQAAEHLLGMLWVHDVIPYAAYINLDPLMQVQRVKQAFGWDENTRFVGYWNAQKLVSLKAHQEPVVVSVFLRKGKALFVIMNNSDEESLVEMVPNWKELDVKTPQELVDAYAEQALKGDTADAPAQQQKTAAIPVSNGTASVLVKARNFRALVAR